MSIEHGPRHQTAAVTCSKIVRHAHLQAVVPDISRGVHMRFCWLPCGLTQFVWNLANGRDTLLLFHRRADDEVLRYRFSSFSLIPTLLSLRGGR